MGKPAEIKTRQNAASVKDFINAVPDEKKRKDSFIVLKLMEKATREKPMMWGPSLIGFGKLRYKSPASGREVDWFRLGFSPRKANLSLYLGLDIKKYDSFLKKLGKHKTGAGCLYINTLADINIDVLNEMILLAAHKQQ